MSFGETHSVSIKCGLGKTGISGATFNFRHRAPSQPVLSLSSHAAASLSASSVPASSPLVTLHWERHLLSVWEKL